ncbi:MAG: hypothetical protein MPJ50_17805 [Pirellulales bacterium]|nr:hypothetical protein [Pirellulales bacterium]
MSTIRTALITGLGMLGLVSVAGCGAENTTTENVAGLAAEHMQPVVLRKAESGEWRLPNARDGMFLVVLCRASNIEKLAASRQDSFRIEDLTAALRESLELKLTAQLAAHRDEFPQASAYEVVSFLDAEIGDATATATFVESELVQVNSAAFAAYELAELKHDDIVAALESRASSFAASKNWNEDDFLDLIAGAVAGLTTAIGGNENYIAED